MSLGPLRYMNLLFQKQIAFDKLLASNLAYATNVKSALDFKNF